MKFILTLFLIIAGFFLFTLVLGVGIFARLVSALGGKKPASPNDQMLLNSLSTLSANERSLITSSLVKNDPTISVLGDQDSLNTLMAKNIIAEIEEATGIIYYRITDTAWQYLQSNRARFA